MSDFEYLQQLQIRMVRLLTNRRNCDRDFPRTCSKASFHRLRLEIQNLMLKIENSMEAYGRYGNKREDWE